MIINRVQSVEVLGQITSQRRGGAALLRGPQDELHDALVHDVREFLVAVPNDGKALNVGANEEAKAKAEAFRARVVEGESFEKLAAELSDASSKANGGLVGPLSRTSWPPTCRRIFDAMKVGDVSAVIADAGGLPVLQARVDDAGEGAAASSRRASRSATAWSTRSAAASS